MGSRPLFVGDERERGDVDQDRSGLMRAGVCRVAKGPLQVYFVQRFTTPFRFSFRFHQTGISVLQHAGAVTPLCVKRL